MLNEINNIISNTFNILNIMDKLTEYEYNFNILVFSEFQEAIINDAINETIWIADEREVMKELLGA